MDKSYANENLSLYKMICSDLHVRGFGLCYRLVELVSRRHLFGEALVDLGHALTEDSDIILQLLFLLLFLQYLLV